MTAQPLRRVFHNGPRLGMLHLAHLYSPWPSTHSFFCHSAFRGGHQALTPTLASSSIPPLQHTLYMEILSRPAISLFVPQTPMGSINATILLLFTHLARPFHVVFLPRHQPCSERGIRRPPCSITTFPSPFFHRRSSRPSSSSVSWSTHFPLHRIGMLCLVHPGSPRPSTHSIFCPSAISEAAIRH